MPSSSIAKAIQQKAQLIKLCIFDIDGVFTSGHIYYGPNQTKMRAFHVYDGVGIKLLHQAGLKVAVISAKQSEDIANRLQDLNIQYIFLGHENKLPAYEEVKLTLNLQDEAVAYMGDDFPDLPLLCRAGLAFTVPDASDLIKNKADYITNKAGGMGAVREVCELILTVQGHYPAMIQSS